MNPHHQHPTYNLYNNRKAVVVKAIKEYVCWICEYHNRRQTPTPNEWIIYPNQLYGRMSRSWGDGRTRLPIHIDCALKAGVELVDNN